MKKRYDVVIIGGGMGGLAAAAILAKKGKSILLIEQKSSLGGYVTTFKREGFVFEAALHIMDSCTEEAPFYKVLVQSGVANKIKFIKPRHLYSAIFPDHFIRVPQNNEDAYIDILSSQFPLQRNGMRKLFFAIETIYKEFYDTPIKKAKNNVPHYKKMLFYSNMTSNDLVSKYLSDYKLKAIIQQIWPYLGLPPQNLSALYFSYAWYGLNHFGGFYPDGGSRAMVSAFQQSITENGGKIILNEKVEKILLKNNEAIGVLSERNNEYMAKVVVSNVNPMVTFMRLIKEGDANRSFINRLTRLNPSISAFQCFLGLKDFIQPKYFKTDYQIFLNSTYDFTKAYDAALQNNIEDAPIAISLCSNLVNDETKNMFHLTAYMPSSYKYWRSLSRKKYYDEKTSSTNRIIKRLRSIFPKFEDNIKLKDEVTPISLESQTNNYEGAIYGWAQLPKQSGLKRLSARGPIKNLFLSGAWSQPGGGVVGAIHSGRNVAEAILNMES